MKRRTQPIEKVLKSFTGPNGEPSPRKRTEFYILKSMWVMMLSEFEGSVKDLVEAHIDKIKRKPIDRIHICLLLQHFYSDSDPLTVAKVLGVYKKNPLDITYGAFTRDFKPKYKFAAIERLFNSLGVFFDANEISLLKRLDGIASTRDSIAHGDNGVQVTKSELVEQMRNLREIYSLLKKKLN